MHLSCLDFMLRFVLLNTFLGLLLLLEARSCSEALYNILIPSLTLHYQVFTDAKLWQMALKVKEDMQSADVTPNTITWSSLINACANAGLVEKALHLFEEMLQAGYAPNSQCCNILLQACVEACQYDRAFRLFWSWKQSPTQEISGEDYDGNYNRISSVDHKDKQCATDTPKFVLNSPHSSFVKSFPFKPTTTTYNILMKACGTDYYRVKALMDEMRTVGLSPNHISWSILIDTCGESGNIKGALQVRCAFYLNLIYFAFPFSIIFQFCHKFVYKLGCWLNDDVEHLCRTS